MAGEKGLCFVIMSFADDQRLKEYYEFGVKQTVERLGYECKRVDEQEFNGSIRQKILGNLQEARFIVADMTHERPNCYYELGMAHALGKEVIHITHDREHIHFDVSDFNFIVYQGINDLKPRLEKRIVDTVEGLKRNVLHLTQEAVQDTLTETTVLSSLSVDVNVKTMQLTTGEALDAALEKVDVVLYSCTPTTDVHEKAERLIDALQRHANPKKLVVFADKDIPDETFRLLNSYPQSSVSKMADALSGRLTNSLS